MKQETPEEETLAKIKFVLLANNDAQAIRLLEQYGGWMQEQNKSKYSEEEVGELVYNIIGEYGKHYGIMIDGAKLNELLEQFKKK